MFTPQILKFETKLTVLDQKLTGLHEVMHAMAKKLDQLTRVFRNNAEWQKKSWKQFEACSKGFQQVREACECLRNELSEAAGTMCDRSWEEACGAGISGGC